ncbi:MAG: DUF1292 domain-containing protein [Lachnospiraceae bacterium]|nr:DUF1292 domain-containing protein [Lachnospiraceae bacterium]MBR0153260.1 DUF1292 domain-containing protein [Lachnospiraceae bacterium]
MDDEYIVTLELDDGSQIDCESVCIFEVDGREYIALLPVGEDQEEVYLYRYLEDEDGNPGIDNIEDDAEYDAASEAFDEYLDSLEFEEFADSEE